MICKNCQKEIDDDSKFCEFCGSKAIKEYKEIINQILKEKQPQERKNIIQSGVKKRKYFHFFKNIILILSVFITTTFFLAVSYNLDEESMLLAIPITILISFIYNKIAKKFNL